ncbi:MAG TPA: hypothetical protein VIP77_07475 [Jiangellaceae bacterium]
MSEQQKPTPPADPTPPAGNSRGSSAKASPKKQSDGGVELYRGEGDEQEKAASTGNSTGPHLHFDAEGVKLQRGDEVVTAYKPATITRLKSEGWTPVEDEDA